MTGPGFFAGLNASVADRDAPFLNFGTLAPDGAGARRSSPTATSLALVERVLGSVDLADRTLLDIGCGRGGALRLSADRRHAAPVIGLDLDPAALAAARHRPRHTTASVIRADALRLPIGTGRVDVVVNIESSCLYGDLPAFFGEVGRVLAPGGHFLYADIVPAELAAAPVEALARAGLEAEEFEDITVDVIASVTARRAIASPAVQDFLSWFSAELQGDDLAYGRLRARRKATTAQPGTVDLGIAGLDRLAEFTAEALSRATAVLDG